MRIRLRVRLGVNLRVMGVATDPESTTDAKSGIKLVPYMPKTTNNIINSTNNTLTYNTLAAQSLTIIKLNSNHILKPSHNINQSSVPKSKKKHIKHNKNKTTMDKQNIKLLKEFLTENNSLKQFEDNIENYGINSSNTKKHYKFVVNNKAIVGAFTWCVTPEGYMFWFNIHHSWLEILKAKTE